MARFLSTKSRIFPIVFFSVAVFQILLSGGITYGWATIVPVFKAEGFFYNLCKEKSLSPEHSSGNNFSHNVNTSLNERNFSDSGIPADSTEAQECAAQRERLNLVFNVAAFTVAAGGLPIGMVLDKYGPRTSMILGCIIYVLAGIGMIVLKKGIENILFLNFIFISLGGAFHAIPLYQTANIVFGKLKSLALCVLNGAFDSSAIILVIFKVVYDSGISLSNIMIFYSSLSLATVLFLILFLIPSQRNLLSLNTMEFSNSQILHSYVGQRLADHDGSIIHKDNEAATNMRMSLLFDHNVSKNGTALNQNEMHGMEAFDEEEADKLCSADKFPDTLKKSAISAIYVLQFVFLSIMQLRLWFFIGTLNSYLNLMLDGNKKSVGKYLEMFGYIQLGGIIVATIIGLIFDRNLIGRKDVKQAQTSRRHKLHSAVLPFALTTLLGVLLSVLSITNSVNALIPTFVLLVFMRGFLYASNATLIGMAFKPEYFGRLYGAVMLFASCVGLLQFPCVVITEKYFAGNPYWTNVVMLILVTITSVHPIYLWHHTRAPKTVTVKEAIVKEGDTSNDA